MKAATTIYCPKCGGHIEIEEDSLSLPIMCPSCGHEFSAQAQGAQGAQESTSRPIHSTSKDTARAIRVHAGDFTRAAILLMAVAALAFIFGVICAMASGPMILSILGLSAAGLFLIAAGFSYLIAQALYIRANTEK